MTNETPENTKPARKGAPLWVHFIVWPLLVGLLVVVALGLNRSQKGTAQVGEQAPDFKVTTFDGEQISLESLRGKVVVLNFWASWCKPCEQEAAELQSSWQQNSPAGDVVFLGMDYVDTEPEALSYIRKFDITFPNAPDMGTKVSQAYRIKGVPETYFIGPDGVVKYIQIGPFESADQINSIIEDIKAE
jgi:cytochrome c biogenesis protein CcmG, thiol:disulfide interchange protein DsbE